MYMFIKNEIKARARLTRGLINILKDDVDMLNIDADNLNLISIEESIKETKDTLHDIMDNINEMEYAVISLKEVKQWKLSNEFLIKSSVYSVRRSNSEESFTGLFFRVMNNWYYERMNLRSSIYNSTTYT